MRQTLMEFRFVAAHSGN